MALAAAQRVPWRAIGDRLIHLSLAKINSSLPLRLCVQYSLESNRAVYDGSGMLAIPLASVPETTRGPCLLPAHSRRSVC